MFDFIDDHLIPLALVFGGICVVVIVWALIVDGEAWDKFSAEHNCRIVGQTSGRSVTTVVPTTKGVGVGMTYLPGQTSYLCDDGVTYTR